MTHAGMGLPGRLGRLGRAGSWTPARLPDLASACANSLSYHAARAAWRVTKRACALPGLLGPVSSTPIPPKSGMKPSNSCRPGQSGNAPILGRWHLARLFGALFQASGPGGVLLKTLVSAKPHAPLLRACLLFNSTKSQYPTSSSSNTIGIVECEGPTPCQPNPLGPGRRTHPSCHL